MTPPIGFRANKKTDSHGSPIEISPAAAIMNAAPVAPAAGTSRGADYAYRIAAVTTGLILLATVM